MNSIPQRLSSSWLWFAIALAVLSIDLCSKAWVERHLMLGQSIVVTDFFNILRAHNPGAAFSFLANASGWQTHFLTVVAVAAALFIVRLLWCHSQHKLFCFALAFILGGAIGNVVDRIRYGYVIDFLDFHWLGRHFATFNLADSAIVFGATLLIVDELRRFRASPKDAAAPPKVLR